MRALAKDDPVWRLAGASKYERNHRGTFSPSTPVSHHTFGWDKARQELVVLDYFGIAGTAAHRMPIPHGLAELFLRRCREVEFAAPFLDSYCPKEEMEDVLKFEGHALSISCSAYKSGVRGRDATLPSLSLASGSTRLRLFFELRDNFAKRIKTLSSSDIQTNLRLL